MIHKNCMFFIVLYHPPIKQIPVGLLLDMVKVVMKLSRWIGMGRDFIRMDRDLWRAVR